MSTADFDNITDVYDALIDWPKRLANEGPFFRRLFERVGARRVLMQPAVRAATPRCSIPGA